jgi:hypothetical protein
MDASIAQAQIEQIPIKTRFELVQKFLDNDTYALFFHVLLSWICFPFSRMTLAAVTYQYNTPHDPRDEVAAKHAYLAWISCMIITGVRIFRLRSREQCAYDNDDVDNGCKFLCLFWKQLYENILSL